MDKAELAAGWRTLLDMPSSLKTRLGTYIVASEIVLLARARLAVEATWRNPPPGVADALSKFPCLHHRPVAQLTKKRRLIVDVSIVI